MTRPTIRQRLRTAAVIVTLAFVACTGERADTGRAAEQGGASAAAGAIQWEEFDYGERPFPDAALRALPLADLQRVRAVIFGRHGRVFQDTTLQAWLATRPWYHPDTAFTNDRLSVHEQANLDRVRAAEAAKHTRIETGDMRFYANRPITTAMLGTHTPQDWELLKAEVLANHGYVFEGDEDEGDAETGSSALQAYFDDRYWYRRRDDFSARELSPIERQNLDTITVAMTRQLGRAVSPGMMHLFQTQPLTEAMLDGVSIVDLRLLRNEVYALHGRPFKTDWLRWHFRAMPWYAERPEFSEAELTAVDRANIALITSRERRLHDELATRLLTVDELRELPSEDARLLRNEIYARRGRRFRDPKLQRYFASFDWYTPNDAYSDAMLTATERENVDLISQYESGVFTEG